MAWTPPSPTVPSFRFEPTLAAADANFRILQTHAFDLQAALLDHPNSPLCPGSEFRPVQLLDPIFTGHPTWPRLRATLLRGAHFPLRPPPDGTGATELSHAIRYGNHKSATANRNVLEASLLDEIKRGWQLPLPVDRLGDIPGIAVAPIGCVQQTTLNEVGARVPKFRMTHDQSFSHQPGCSVNDRVIDDDLFDCQYGHTISKILHWIVALRQLYPSTPILASKFDVKQAYRRVHLDATSALQSTTTTKGLLHLTIALICLRMTFGGKPCPALFSELSETLADLCNILARLEGWDPSAFTHRFMSIIGSPRYLASDVPFTAARPLSVDPQADPAGTSFPYLDDFNWFFVALSNATIFKASHVVPFVFDLLGRPPGPLDPLPREELLAVTKAKAEGTPGEIATILGWEIDTRRLTIRLPYDKWRIWSEDLHAIIHQKGPIPWDKLATMVGRLNHLTAVVPPAAHFLSRLQSAKERASNPPRHAFLTREERADGTLFLDFLRQSQVGFDINLLVLRTPDHHIETDACNDGIGGFCHTSGRAWQWKLPPHLAALHINVKEFLACIVGIRIELVEGRLRAGDCVLCKTDNTTAMGWLRRSNFTTNKEGRRVHLLLARALARLLLDHHLCLFSQYLEGARNCVADLLSRDFTRSHSELTSHICTSFPAQIPTTFGVSPFPNDVASWLSLTLPMPTFVTASSKIRTARPTAIGPSGSTSLPLLGSTPTLSSMTSLPSSANVPSAPSHSPSAIAPGAGPPRVILKSNPSPVKPPSKVWHRPLWPAAALTPP